MFGAIASLAGPIIGGMIGADAAKDASRMQGQAAEAATAEQRRQFDLTRQDQMPWLETGQHGIRTIADLIGLNDGSGALMRDFSGADLANDPGYAFRLGEGNKAIENAARARGMYSSPATIKELLRYGQDYASGEFQNAYNRDMANRTTKYNFLAGASGAGQTAANTLGNAGMNMAGTVGQLITGAANARGAARIAGANSWNNALAGAVNHYQQNNMIEALRNGGKTPPWMQGYTNPFATVQN